MRFLPLFGTIADGSRLVSRGRLYALVTEGEHKGHVLEVSTSKSHTGDYQTSAVCSCGRSWSKDGTTSTADESLREVVEEILGSARFQPGTAPGWYQEWLEGLLQMYRGSPEEMVLAVSAGAAALARLLDGLLKKSLTFKQVRDEIANPSWGL